MRSSRWQGRNQICFNMAAWVLHHLYRLLKCMDALEETLHLKSHLLMECRVFQEMSIVQQAETSLDLPHLLTWEKKLPNSYARLDLSLNCISCIKLGGFILLWSLWDSSLNVLHFGRNIIFLCLLHDIHFNKNPPPHNLRCQNSCWSHSLETTESNNSIIISNNIVVGGSWMGHLCF